jgi:hypothetical protein
LDSVLEGRQLEPQTQYFSIQPILEWNCVTVGKGLNCVFHPLVFPSENVFYGVEKAMGVLPEEFAEDVWQGSAP